MAEVTQNDPAFMLFDVKKVSMTEIPKPVIRDPYDVVVKVGQTGICGSDVHYWQEGHIGDLYLTTPIVLGHESSGTIVEVGSSVTNVKPGDRVAIEPGLPCRHCDYCRSGSYNICPDTVFAATPPHHGTLSRHYRTAADYCYPLPDHMSLEEGALCEPVAVAVQACKTGDIKAGQTVVVFGCGPVGLLCQSVAKAYAAKKVIGIDVSKSRLDMAKNVLKCADGVFEPPKMETVTGSNRAEEEMNFSIKVARLINEQLDLGQGPDVVLEATGAQSCIQSGVHLTKKGGTYVQIGMGRENVHFPITVACVRALTIRGSIRYTTGCYSTALDLVASGKIDVKKIVTHRFEFKEAEKAYETVKNGGEHVLKVMISGVPN